MTKQPHKLFNRINNNRTELPIYAEINHLLQKTFDFIVSQLK